MVEKYRKEMKVKVKQFVKFRCVEKEELNFDIEENIEKN